MQGLCKQIVDAAHSHWSFKGIVWGVQGVYKQMVEAFRALGVEAVPGPGNIFDPEFHEAIMREENDDVPDGTVLKEFRRGFKLGNQLLRAAMVQVMCQNRAVTDFHKPVRCASMIHPHSHLHRHAHMVSTSQLS